MASTNRSQIDSVSVQRSVSHDLIKWNFSPFSDHPKNKINEMKRLFQDISFVLVLHHNGPFKLRRWHMQWVIGIPSMKRVPRDDKLFLLCWLWGRNENGRTSILLPSKPRASGESDDRGVRKEPLQQHCATGWRHLSLRHLITPG